MRPHKPYKPKRTVNTLLWYYEEQFTQRNISRIPAWVQPHYLTIVGFLAAIFAGISYAFSSYFPWLLWLASFFLIINFLGDKFDGSLARHRGKVSNFGLYQDHMIDGFSTTLMFLGITASTLTFRQFWLVVGICYLLLEIQTALLALIQHRFIISYWKLGPTEARLLLIMINTITFFLYPTTFIIFNMQMSVLDIAGGIGAIVLGIVVFTEFLRSYRRLYFLEKDFLEK